MGLLGNALVFVQLDTLEHIVSKVFPANMESTKKYASMVYPFATAPSAAVNVLRDIAVQTARPKISVQLQITDWPASMARSQESLVIVIVAVIRVILVSIVRFMMCAFMGLIICHA